MAHGGGKLAVGKQNNDPTLRALLRFGRKAKHAMGHLPGDHSPGIDTYTMRANIRKGKAKPAGYRGYQSLK